MVRADSDAAAWLRALIDEHGRVVEALLVDLERDRATREDLWAEVFATSYARLDHLGDRSPEKVRAWLFRSARYLTANTARRAITRTRGTVRLAGAAPRPTPSAEERYFEGPGAITPAEKVAVSVAWDAMSDSHQEVLALDAMGFDGPDIAERLGITAVAARSRLMRARRSFLQAYQDAGAASP